MSGKRKYVPKVWVVEFLEGHHYKRGHPSRYWAPFSINGVFNDKRVADAVCAVYAKGWEQYKLPIVPWRVRAYVRRGRRE